MSFHQVKTTIFSRVGVSSSSAVTFAPWSVKGPLATSRLSSVKDIKR